MSKSRLDPKRGLVDRSHVAKASQNASDKALIVANSRVNRVVISKILEKSGLQSTSLDPQAALGQLGASLPDIVILDGGADNRECDALIPQLVALRASSGDDRPRTILLTTRTTDKPRMEGVIDALVVKPITTELLQPVVDRLLNRGL